MKNYTKLITSLAALVAVVGIWGGLLACTSDLTPAWVENTATASSTPTLPPTDMTTNVLPKETTVTEYKDPTITDLPLEVQTYASMAKSMVAHGMIPRDRVTIDLIQADVAREYGITLTAAQADAVRDEVLG